MGQHLSRRTTSTTSRGDEIVIVVIGASGVGKSTFINTAAGQASLEVGHGLEPCTTKVEHVRCMIDFEGSLKQVVFVDTPAFPGDGTLTVWDIENKIKTFGKGINFTGILYLYDITQKRMTEPPHLLFQRICGNEFHGRVLLVTTMWKNLKNLQDGENRKVELERHWSQTTNKKIVCHDGTMKGACDVVKALVG